MSEKSESLSRNFAFRLTEEDGAIWDEKIASSGLKSNSEFIREAVIKNKSEVVSAPRKIRFGAPKLPLGNTRRNMNQIAHRLQFGQSNRPGDARSLCRYFG